MELKWPWRKVEELERVAKKDKGGEQQAPVSLDDDVELDDTEETEVSGEIERVVKQTKQSMNDGLDRLKRALAELEAEVHAIKGDDSNG